MRNTHNGVADAPQTSDLSFLYSYLGAGIALILAVMIFLPRMAAG